MYYLCWCNLGYWRKGAPFSLVVGLHIHQSAYRKNYRNLWAGGLRGFSPPFHVFIWCYLLKIQECSTYFWWKNILYPALLCFKSTYVPVTARGGIDIFAPTFFDLVGVVWLRKRHEPDYSVWLTPKYDLKHMWATYSKLIYSYQIDFAALNFR